MSDGWWQPWVPCAMLVVISLLAAWVNETLGTCCLMITAAVITVRIQDSPFVPAIPLMIPLVGLVRVSTKIPVAAAASTTTITSPSPLPWATMMAPRGLPCFVSPSAFPSPFPVNSPWRQPPSPPRANPLSAQPSPWRDHVTMRSELGGEVSRRDMLFGLGALGLAGLSIPKPAPAVGLQEDEVPRAGFRTKSGVKYYDIREGEGSTPKWGQVCIVHYEGYCRPTPNAPLVLFDDTYSRHLPYIIKHGNGRLIKGLEEGLHTMKLGGYRRIVVPLSLGYTRAALGPFPPNSLRRKILYRELRKAEASDPPGELVFDVELLSVYDDEADQGYYEAETIDNKVVEDGLAKTLQTMGQEGMALPTPKSGKDRFPFNKAEWDNVSLPEVL